MPVRPEYDRGLLRDARDHLLRITRRTDHIRERLDLRRSVDVRHNRMPRALLYKASESLRRTAIGQRAPSIQIRQHDRLLGVQNLGRLRHKMDPAEYDHVRVRPLRLPRQPQRIPDKVRKILYLRLLIIVRQNYRVQLTL